MAVFDVKEDAINIGDSIFKPTKVDYFCQIPSEEGYYLVPYNGVQCWGSFITFLGNYYSVKHTDNVIVSPYFSFDYASNGKLKVYYSDLGNKYSYITDWSNVITFNINGGIALSLANTDKYLTDNDKIKVIITNNLPKNSEAFILFDQKSKITNYNHNTKIIPIILNEGENLIEISDYEKVDGINEFNIQVGYPIYSTNQETIYYSGNLNTKYSITDEIPFVRDNNGQEVCVQVITSACNPLTKDIKNFLTPCDVPNGWVTDTSVCKTPQREYSNLFIWYILIFIILVIVFNRK